MQKLWKKKLKWNESFEFVEGLKDEWLCLVKESHIAVSRCFDRNAFFNSTSEFHIFSDASRKPVGLSFTLEPLQGLSVLKGTCI